MASYWTKFGEIWAKFPKEGEHFGLTYFLYEKSIGENVWTTFASSSDKKFVQIWVKTTSDIPWLSTNHNGIHEVIPDNSTARCLPIHWGCVDLYMHAKAVKKRKSEDQDESHIYKMITIMSVHALF